MKRRFRNKLRRRRAAAMALVPVALVAMGTSMTLAAVQTSGATTLDASRDAVAHGERIALRGVTAAAAGTTVAIQFRRARGTRWSHVRRIEADGAGHYSTSVRARYSGRYRAVPGQGEPSPPQRLRVRSRVTLKSEKYALAGRGLQLSGRVRPAGRRSLSLRAGSGRSRARTSRDGRFEVRVPTGGPGVVRPHVRAGGDPLAAGDSDRARKVTIYRRAHASWYGPGLYGNRLACGGTLTTGTIGVAHKTLPCGTKVRLRLGRRTVTAPVVDRGPYVRGREYDLTAATKRKLGFGSTGTVLASK